MWSWFGHDAHRPYLTQATAVVTAAPERGTPRCLPATQPKMGEEMGYGLNAREHHEARPVFVVAWSSHHALVTGARHDLALAEVHASRRPMLLPV